VVEKVDDFTAMATDKLPAALSSASTWAMRAAWHQMAERQDKSVIPALVALLEAGETRADTRIHALWTLEELGHFDAALWQRLLADGDENLRREAVRAMTTLLVPQSTGAGLLEALAGESEWTVRCEILRYFRRAAGPVSGEALAWLRKWGSDPAPETKVNGWKGPNLAMDGSYQRAFQDFLFRMAETKTQLPVMAETKWNRVIAVNDTKHSPEEMQALIRKVKEALPGADAAAGQAVVESTCLTCHAFGGKGVGFAPPLDGSSNRDLDGLITAIVDPDAAIESVFRQFRVITKEGVTVEGFNKGEDRDSITLLLMGGVPQVIPLGQVKDAGYVEGRSVMPRLAEGMTAEQIAGIVRYLREGKTTRP
jgi:putative heme-binding domain-containing protein